MALAVAGGVLTPAIVMDVDKVHASTSNPESDFTVTDYLDGIKITQYIGSRKDVVIPSTIGGKHVTSIGRGAFSNQGLTSLVIPEGITRIEYEGVSHNNLTEVTLPVSLNYLENYAFENNNLQTVIFKNEYTVIETNGLRRATGSSNSDRNLVIYGYDPSTAKDYALTFHSFKNINELPVPPDAITPLTEWSFSDPSQPFIGVKPTITLIGGKPATDILISSADWVEEETTVPTEYGSITFSPDGQGNTLLSVPTGLGDSNTATTVNVEYESTHFMNINIKAAPQLNFTFGK